MVMDERYTSLDPLLKGGYEKICSVDGDPEWEASVYDRAWDEAHWIHRIGGPQAVIERELFLKVYFAR